MDQQKLRNLREKNSGNALVFSEIFLIHGFVVK